MKQMLGRAAFFTLLFLSAAAHDLPAIPGSETLAKYVPEYALGYFQQETPSTQLHCSTTEYYTPEHDVDYGYASDASAFWVLGGSQYGPDYNCHDVCAQQQVSLRGQPLTLACSDTILQTTDFSQKLSAIKAEWTDRFGFEWSTAESAAERSKLSSMPVYTLPVDGESLTAYADIYDSSPAYFRNGGTVYWEVVQGAWQNASCHHQTSYWLQEWAGTEKLLRVNTATESIHRLCPCVASFPGVRTTVRVPEHCTACPYGTKSLGGTSRYCDQPAPVQYPLSFQEAAGAPAVSTAGGLTFALWRFTQPEAQRSVFVRCGPGTEMVVDLFFRTSASDEIMYNALHYAVEDTQQTQLPAGTWHYDYSCRACPMGYYASGSGSVYARCVQCPAGTSTLQVGSVSAHNCSAPCRADAAQAYLEAQRRVVQTPRYTDAVTVVTRPYALPVKVYTPHDLPWLACICGPGRVWDYIAGACSACGSNLFQNESFTTTGCRACAIGTGTYGETGMAACAAPCPMWSGRAIQQTVQDGFTVSTFASTCAPCGANEYSRSDDALCRVCPGNLTLKYPTTMTDDIVDEFCREPCAPGFYEDTVTLLCMPCAKGSFKPSAGGEACTLCSSLRAHATTVSVGATSAEACVCPAGYGASAPNGACTACAVGQFKADDADTPCLHCATGKITAATASVSADLCQVCPDGTTFDAGTAGDVCVACPAGKYAAQADYDSYVTKGCQLCPAQTYSLTEGAVSIDTCLPCADGLYSSPGSAECGPCKGGAQGATVDACTCLPEYEEKQQLAPLDTTSNYPGATWGQFQVRVQEDGFLYSDRYGAGHAVQQMYRVASQAHAVQVNFFAGDVVKVFLDFAGAVETPAAVTVALEGAPIALTDQQTYLQLCKQGYDIQIPAGDSVLEVTHGSKTFEITLRSEARPTKFESCFVDVACGPGRIVDLQAVQRLCQPCPVGTFQPDESGEQCTPCATGTTTLQTGAQNAADCVCAAGYGQDTENYELIADGGLYYLADDAGKTNPNPTLTLTRGRTTIIKWPESAEEGGLHPVIVSETSGWGDASATFAVTTQPTTTITVPADFTGTLHYYCQYHQSMKGVLNVVDASCQPCGLGEFKAHAGSEACTPCAGDGAYADEHGLSACKRCPAGFRPTLDRHACEPCDLAAGDCANVTLVPAVAEQAKHYLRVKTPEVHCDALPCNAAPGTYCAHLPCSNVPSVCPGGFFCVGGAAAPQACAAPAGMFCEEGAVAADDLTACPAGSFCPGGSADRQVCPERQTSPAQAQSLASCVCAPGHTAADDGQGCQACRRGKVKIALGDQACSDCEAGFFAKAGWTLPCKPCPAGFSSQAGDESGCSLCPAGKRSGEGALCVDCEGGKYGTATRTQCLPCPTLASSSPGSATVEDCACDRGYTLQDAASFTCTACGADTFKDTIGNTTCAACDHAGCTAGVVLDGCAAANPGTCVACAPGLYKDATSIILYGHDCQQCAGGKYSASDSKSCIDCPAGTFSTVNSVSSVCTDCARGKYSTSSGGSSSSTCIDCSRGKYSSTLGATSSSTCQNCPAGKYSSGYAAPSLSSCSACPAGKYQASSGRSYCSNCVGGKVQEDSGKTSCENCEDYWVGRDIGYGTITQPKRGSYSQSTTKCYPCGPGTYASPDESRCFQCTGGKYHMSFWQYSSDSCH